VGAEAQLRRGLGKDRIAAGLSEGGERLGKPHVGLTPADDEPAGPVANVAGHHLDQRIARRRGPGARRLDERALTTALQGELRGGADIVRAGLRAQRIAPREVQVHRPRARLAARDCKGTTGDRSQMQEAVVVGLVGTDLAEPPRRAPVELQLIDGLAGADFTELRRAIGRQDEQRHAGLVRLADGGMEVRGGRAGGAEDGDGQSRRLCGSEREEAGRALVDDDRGLDIGRAPQRERHRRRA
jgi:hypothetical protein